MGNFRDVRTMSGGVQEGVKNPLNSLESAKNVSDTYNLLQKQKYPCKFTDLGDFFCQDFDC